MTSNNTALHIFLVTIERNLPRCEVTRAALQQQGIEAEVWLGVDGTKGDRDIAYKEGERVNRMGFFTRRQRSVEPTEIGCYLSHYRLMKYALKEQLPQIFVFEDDARLKPGIRAVLEALALLPDSVEHVNFNPQYASGGSYGIAMQDPNLMAPLRGDYQLIRTPRHGLGTVGYMITLGGIRKIMPHLMPIQSEVDVATRNHATEADLRLFDVYPAPVSHQGRNLIQKRKITGRLASVVRDLKKILTARQRKQHWRHLDRQWSVQGDSCKREHAAKPLKKQLKGEAD